MSMSNIIRMYLNYIKIYRSYTQMLMDDDLILGSEIVKIRELTPLEMMLGVVETDLGTIEF